MASGSVLFEASGLEAGAEHLPTSQRVIQWAGSVATHAYQQLFHERHQTHEREVVVIGPKLPTMGEQLESGLDLSATVHVAERYVSKEDQEEPRTMTERGVLEDFQDFLATVRRVAAADPEVGDPRSAGAEAVAAANIFAEQTTFLSTALRQQAVSGLAERHIKTLRENPKAHVILWVPQHQAESSQGLINDEMMRHINSTAPEVASRVLMTSDLEQQGVVALIRSHKPRDLVFGLADDWIISGSQAFSDVGHFAADLERLGLLEGYGQCIEVERLVGRDDQIEAHFSNFQRLDSTDAGHRTRLLPPRVVVYFNAPAPAVLDDGLKLPVPAGSHTCPDYGFRWPISTVLMQYLVNQNHKRGLNDAQLRRYPYLVTIQRPESSKGAR